MFFLHLFHICTGSSRCLSLQGSRQAVFGRNGRSLSHCSRIGFSLYRISRSLVVQQATGTVVGRSQYRHDIFCFESFPKFQVGRTLQEFSHTFRFLDTRQFHHDTAHLSFQCLDVRLSHTKTVDTCTQNIVRVVYGSFYFLAQYFLNFCICTTGIHFVFQLLGGKKFSKFAFRSQFLVFSDKQGHEIFLTVNLQFGSFSHSLVKGFIRFVVGQRLHYVRYGNLQNDVHTTFQVQTQPDFHLTTLFQRVNSQPHLLILHGIQVMCRTLRVLSRLVHLITGNE